MQRKLATEDLNLMFEQPCETLDDIAAIKDKHAAPVSVDESLVTLQDAARIDRDGLAEIIRIKLNRVGGLTRAARIRDIALAHGIDMFVMANGGSVLARIQQLLRPSYFRAEGSDCTPVTTYQKRSVRRRCYWSEICSRQTTRLFADLRRSGTISLRSLGDRFGTGLERKHNRGMAVLVVPRRDQHFEPTERCIRRRGV